MPHTTSDIGSSGLEQGGSNLGNDISRRVTTDRNEQNTTTNVGSHPSEGNKKQENSEDNLDTEEGDEGGSTPDPEDLSLRDE